MDFLVTAFAYNKERSFTFETFDQHIEFKDEPIDNELIVKELT